MRPYLLAAALLLATRPALAAPPDPAPAASASASPPPADAPAAAPPGPAEAPAADAPAAAEAPPPPPPPPEEVMVLGNKASKAPGSVHVLRREQLDRQRYDDPHQVFTSVPGVYARGEDGFGLRPNIGIRGAASDRSKKLTLMEDGVLFAPAPYSAPAAYYFPLMARMRSVRVIKGPSAVVYGPQTVGGAVDLLTRDIPSSRQGQIDVAVGRFFSPDAAHSTSSKVHLVYGASDEKMGFLVEGVRLSNGGFKTIDGDPGADTGFVRNEWMSKASYVLDLGGTTHHELGLKLGYSDEVSHETYLGISDADFRASPYRRYAASRNDVMKWKRSQVELTHRAVMPGGFEAQTTVYRHDLGRDWVRYKELRALDPGDKPTTIETLGNPAANPRYYGAITGAPTDGASLMIGPNDRAFVSEGIQTVLKKRLRTGPVEHRLEYGARIHYDEIVRNQSETPYQLVNNRLVPDYAGTVVTDDNEVSTRALAFHLVDQIGYKRLLITPGARLELIQARAIDHASGRQASRAYEVLAPGVGVYAGLTSELGLLAGVHRGFSPAPPEAGLTAAAGQPAPAPEKSTNYEGGVRYDSRRLRVEAIGFYNDYQNLTDICTESNGCSAQNLNRQFNAGAVSIYGVELFAEGKLPLGRGLAAPLRAAYTLTRSRFRTSFTSADETFGNVVAGDELPYIPRHQASGSVGVEGERWGVNVSGTYVGSMRERAGGSPDRLLLDEDPKTDAYFLLDASASLKPWRRVTVYLNGRNLLDNAYLVARRPLGARPGAPRFAQLGVQVQFD